MRIIFLATPDFALPSLRALTASRHDVAAVVCQPDRPQGRKMTLTKPPVKVLAEELGIPVFQFERLRAEGVEDLKSLGADIMVTCAYGQILTQEILDLCPHGVINVHGSLLPKYRGAAPIQWAVINGERETGVTIMQTERGLDCGDILLVERTEIGATETAGELFSRLSELGAAALLEALDRIESGTAVFVKQNEAEATHFPMLKKTDGVIDFEKSADEIVNLVRGVSPWPGAYAFLDGKMLKVFRAEPDAEWAAASAFRSKLEIKTIQTRRGPVVLPVAAMDILAGTVVKSSPKDGLIVACGDGAVRLSEIQPEGGRRMPDLEFLKGRRIPEGTVLARGKE